MKGGARALFGFAVLLLVGARGDEETRTKTGYWVTASDGVPDGNDGTPSKPHLPCYLLGEREQHESPAAKKARNSQGTYYPPKRADHKQKPFPSLTQCYRYNTFACCVSGHDTQIKSDYESLLSGTCLREYEPLENYYCLGCHFEQGKFTTVYSEENCVDSSKAEYKKDKFGEKKCKYYIADFEKIGADNAKKAAWSETNAALGCPSDNCLGHLKLCKRFVHKMLFPDCSMLTKEEDCSSTEANQCCWQNGKCYNGEQDESSPVDQSNQVYKCKHGSNAGNPFKDPEAWKAKSVYDGCGLSVSGNGYVLPSFYFENFTDFIVAIKPPYFEHFAVTVVDEDDQDGDGIGEGCYTSGASRTAVTMLTVAVVAAMAAFTGLD